jgi:hypothetical protein
MKKREVMDDEGSETSDAVPQRKESRRALGPKAVATLNSRDGEQDCTIEG